jgi:AbrB family looped-hinge helix DNA binding protein
MEGSMAKLVGPGLVQEHRKPAGFWRRATTAEILAKCERGEISETDAAALLACPVEAVRWYVARLQRERKNGRPQATSGRVARATIGEGGRLVIPAHVRQELGLNEGDEVILRLTEGELRILTPESALRRAQALVRQYVSPNRSLADELIRERRQEARRE